MWPGWKLKPWLFLQNQRISNLAFKPETLSLNIQLEIRTDIVTLKIPKTVDYKSNCTYRKKDKRTENTVTRSWMKSSQQVIYISGKHTKYIYYDDGNTRVTLVCLSRLISIFIAQSYTNYIQISGGNYIPYDDGIHTASLVIGVYNGTNEIPLYGREGEIWRALALTNIRFWTTIEKEDIRFCIWRRFWH